MNSKTIKKALICELTDKERREYGISLATTLGDMEQVEAQKKAEMDNFKNRLAGMQAKIDELSGKVRNGKEWRDVTCCVVYGQPDKEHKQTVRLDTMEVVQTELMTETDLQLVMPLDILKYAMDPGDRLGVLTEGALSDEFLKEGDGEEDEDLMIPEDEDGPIIVDFPSSEDATPEGASDY